MTYSAEGPLQEAGERLRCAVEILRRRPADDVAAKCLVDELHELRTMMSATALLMESFELPRFAMLLHPRDRGSSTAVLSRADADLRAAFDHLNSAAANLTAARQRLDTLS